MSSKSNIKSGIANYVINISIILLLGLCVYFVFSLIKKPEVTPTPPETVNQIPETTTRQFSERIQIDVRNASGVSGLAGKFTDFLRENGFDVVEMGNFETSEEELTIILDRKGNNTGAMKKIASALGVNERNIIQQVNKELFLDATVVIGKDFNELKPFTQIK